MSAGDLPGWVDRRTGLCGPPEPGPGPWPLADLVHRVRCRVHVPGCPEPVTAAGAGPDADAARTACLGEALERYAASRPRPADLVTPLAGLAGRAHLAPHDLGLAVPDDEPVEWLVADDGRVVPRAAVGLAVDGAQTYPQGSTGLAGGPDRGTAREGAAAEVLERHVVATAWRSGRLRPAPAATVLPATVLAATAGTGLELVAHLLPAPGGAAPVALVAVRDRQCGVLGVGAAWRPDPAAAALKAWHEAVVSVAQAAELLDAVTGPALAEVAGLPPWRADRRYAHAGWAHVTDLARQSQLLLDPAVADPVWSRLAATDVPPAPVAGGATATDALRAWAPGTAVVDLGPEDLPPWPADRAPVVVRVLTPGAETVRPAGLTPEELPCPLT